MPAAGGAPAVHRTALAAGGAEALSVAWSVPTAGSAAVCRGQPERAAGLPWIATRCPEGLGDASLSSAPVIVLPVQIRTPAPVAIKSGAIGLGAAIRLHAAGRLPGSGRSPRQVVPMHGEVTVPAVSSSACSTPRDVRDVPPPPPPPNGGLRLSSVSLPVAAVASSAATSAATANGGYGLQREASRPRVPAPTHVIRVVSALSAPLCTSGVSSSSAVPALLSGRSSVGGGGSDGDPAGGCSSDPVAAPPAAALPVATPAGSRPISRASSARGATATPSEVGSYSFGGGSSSSAGDDQARFWKPAVSRLYRLYIQPRQGAICGALSQLDVHQWRHLLDYVEGLRSFLSQPPLPGDVAPPAVPMSLLARLLSAYASGQASPLPKTSVCEAPLWYLEVMQVTRVLLQPVPSGRRPSALPSRSTQFVVHLLSASPVAAFLVEALRLGLPPPLPPPPPPLPCGAGAPEDGVGPSKEAESEDAAAVGSARGHAEEELRRLGADGRLWLALGGAWGQHGGDVLLACQHVLIRLFPESAEHQRLHGPRAPLPREDVPAFTAVLVAAALHLSVHLLSEGARRTQDGMDSLPGSPLASEAPTTPLAASSKATDPNSSLFAGMMNSQSLFGIPPLALLGNAEKFFVALRDVLFARLGPGPASPDDLPPPAAEAEETPGSGDERAIASPNIKVLARIVRTLIQAYYTNPAVLAAVEEEREQSAGPPDALAGGSFSGPSSPDDFLHLPPQEGPLRRSLAFMEQSALLQAVQSKLCAQRFDDIVGATEQLEEYALRNLRVLWFDLRRCTSTLKNDPKGAAQDGQNGGTPAGRTRGVVPLVLVLRNMRLCLTHGWEAKLATFPYLHLLGSSQVTVRSLAISVHLSLSFSQGVVFHAVEVGLPDLDVQLGCTSSFSQVVLSALLRIFQASLQDQLQKQMQRMMLQMLRQESGKWNESIWRRLQSVVPERLISRGFDWVRANIPPEGLPI